MVCVASFSYGDHKETVHGRGMFHVLVSNLLNKKIFSIVSILLSVSYTVTLHV